MRGKYIKLAVNIPEALGMEGGKLKIPIARLRGNKVKVLRHAPIMITGTCR